MRYLQEEQMNDYDPDAMFPQRAKPPRFWAWERITRWAIIVGLSAFVIFVGAGCGSLRNVKEIDFGFGGLEMEFYPAHPSQEEKSIFDFGIVTNRIHATPVAYPRLMPLRER